MLKSPRRIAEENGTVLVITVVVMLGLFVAAAYAIDASFWFVHDRHLQTQADAAAFAGGDEMELGFENGDCSNSSVASTVSQYDGTQTVVAGQQLPANQQVPSASTTATDHNIFDVVNGANFNGQSIPNDTGLTGAPCTDEAVDVKMTETNLPSFLTFLKPPYINKQAQVRAEGVSAQKTSPFVLPNITTPTHAAVFVVGENPATPAFASDTILAKLGGCADTNNTTNTPPCLTSSNGNGTWAASGLSVPFGSGPASLVVAQSTSAISAATLQAVTDGPSLASFCSTAAITCYDRADGTGLTYTRTYTASSPNFPAAAPAVEDTSLADAPGDPTSCQGDGTGQFTGFITSNAACNVNVTAHIDFGTETCDDLANNLKATLTLTASTGGSATLDCPNPGSTTASSASGNWKTHSPIAITPNQGPVTFDLTWSRTGGGSAALRESWEQGGNNSTPPGCGNGGNTCTSDFRIIARAFTGAYDQSSANTSNSGPVSGVALTSGGGAVLTSTPAGGTVNGLNVTIDFQVLSDVTALPSGHVPPGSFIDIAYGTNQANGLADCGQGVNNAPGPNGFDVQENAIGGLFTCNNYPVEPSSFTANQCTQTLCPNTVPGQKFLQWLDGGLATLIYGCPEASHSTANNEQNGCSANGSLPLSPAACAAHPNYWSTQNLVSTVVNNKSDTRLVSVMVTDSGQLRNGNQLVPVRLYATFYITGWTYDPCSGVSVNGQNNGEFYVNDDVAPTDAAGDIFLVGHFVHDFVPNANPDGHKCDLSSIGNCTLTLTK